VIVIGLQILFNSIAFNDRLDGFVDYQDEGSSTSKKAKKTPTFKK
jgi:hypothetical protein